MSPRKFERPTGVRSYHKLFVIATEGEKTEPIYFSIFNNLNSHKSVVRVKFLKGKSKSAPQHVLNRMKHHLQQEKLKPYDEAWLVVDKDQWSDDQLYELSNWAQVEDNYGFALSNPKFEYWLLLHFEDGENIKSSKDCSDRLKKHIPGYNKSIDPQNFKREMINKAIGRAKKRDNPPCKDWPRCLGSTTVYRLIENILGPEKQTQQK